MSKKLTISILTTLTLILIWVKVIEGQSDNTKYKEESADFDSYINASISEILDFISIQRDLIVDKNLFHIQSNRLLALHYKQKKAIDSAAFYFEKALITPNYENEQQIALTAQCARDLGLLNNQLNQLEAAKFHFKLAQQYFSETKLLVHAKNAQNQYAEVLRKQGQSDSALLILNQIISETESVDSLYFPLALALEYKGRLLMQNKSYFESAKYHTRAYNLLKHDTVYASSWKALILNSLYFVYNRLENHPKSIQYLEESKRIYESEEKVSPLNMASLYHNLGNAYKKQGDISLALHYLRGALSINKKLLPSDHPKLINNHLLLGLIYKAQANYAEAIEALKPIVLLNNDESLDITHNRLLANFYTADSYLYLEQNDSCNKYLFHIEQFLSQQKESDPLLEQFLAYRKGNLYKQKGLLDSSLHFFHYAWHSTKTLHYAEQKVHEMQSVLQLAKNHLLLNQLDSCYFYTQILVAHTINDSLRYEKTDYDLEIIKLRTLDLLASYHHQKWLRNKTEADKIKSLTFNQETFDHLRSIKSNFKEKESEISINALHHELFDAGLHRLYSFYTDSKSSDPVSMAMNIIETRQYILLKSAFKRNYLKDSHLIPANELEKEDSLEASILYNEKILFLNRTNTDSVYEALNTDKETLNNLRKSWTTKYPDYYKLVYEDEIVNLKETQSLLGSNQQLIAFHLGEDATYVLSLTKDSYSFTKNNKKVSAQDVSEFKRLLLDRTIDFTTFENQAQNLYNELFIGTILSKPNLVIIPHGHLSYIPFEVLVSPKKDKAENFKDLNYLIKNYNISYTFAASMVSFGNRLKYRKQKGVLGIAPDYAELPSSNRGLPEFGKLLFNKNEVKNIQNIFGGKVLEDSSAHILQIQKEKSKYAGIHFAAHAVIDERNPDFSYLALDGAATNDSNKLFIKDLYNQQWKNEMVVLSACETATGHLMQGEGIISLGRAFTFSGTKSVVSSLWKINDQSTSVLMGCFYNYLKKNKRKDEALRLAKLEFMNNQKNQNLSHPYYWAAFVLYGDNEKMYPTFNWWWMAAGILIFGFLMWVFVIKPRGIFIRSKSLSKN